MWRIVIPWLLACVWPAFGAPPALDSASRDYDQQHLKVELTDLQIRSGRIEARTTISLSPLREGGLRLVRLHAVGLSVSSVTLGGQRCSYSQGRPTELHVTLPRSYRRGETLSLVIRYTATPRRGLFFFSPDKDYPERPVQVWSQGEAVDNRRWIPCYDLPDDRLTSELVVTAPRGLQVVSNGRLVSQEGRVWHWRQERPHVSYLITLVVGRFEQIEEKAEGVRVRSLFPRGRAAEARNAFGLTGKMLSFFSKRLGTYPWPHYDQIVVHDFLYGGMENTGATTLNARALHDDRGKLDYSADELVSHELAHQWFGNLVTCRTFAHIWLNEGFATYMSELWRAKHLGREAFLVSRRASLRGVISGSRTSKKFRFKRGKPAGLTGGAAYSRGAAILHALRERMGDARFFRGVRDYLSAQADKSVDTETFRKAMEGSSGLDLKRFFDDWVYRPGVPKLRLFWNYSAERKALLVGVTQLQRHRIYQLRLPVLLMTRSGPLARTIEVTGQDQMFTFSTDASVTDLVVDPWSSLPVAVEKNRSAAEWIRLAREKSLYLVRLEAVEQLAKHQAEGRPVLVQALAHDPLWQIRRAAAKSLGRVGGEAAITALIAALSDRNARVRRAAVESLGRLKATRAAGVLQQRLTGDPSYWVQAAAAHALLGVQTKGLYERLAALLPQTSYRSHLRSGLLGALGSLGNAKAIPLAARYAACKTPNDRATRTAALGCLNKLRKGRPAVERLLIGYLADPDYRIRRQVLGFVDRGKIRSASSALAQMAQKEVRVRLRKRAAEVLQKLTRNTEKGK